MKEDKGGDETISMEDQINEARIEAMHTKAAEADDAANNNDAKAASNNTQGGSNKSGCSSSSSAEVGNAQQTASGGENDSASSSNGRGSGSGSGGGYNGDCSSSDASSDASSKRKNASSELPLSIEKMSLNEQGNQDNPRGVKADMIPIHHPKKKKKKRSTEEGDTKVIQINGQSRSTALPEEYDLGSNASSSGRSASHVAHQLGALDAILEQSRRMQEEKKAQDGEVLPQWQGVRVSHPMDPRIDLSTVGHVPCSSVPLALSAPQDVAPPSLDNYLHLMEAVRPFFMAYGIAPPGPTPMMPIQLDKGGSDGTNGGTGSSEGFTAFFTTTEKSNSSDSTSNQKSNQASNNSDGQQPAERHQVANSSSEGGSPDGAAALPEGLINIASLPSRQQEQQHSQDSSQDDSDTSSMVVLARVKRKHQRKERAGDNEADSNDSLEQQDDSANASPSHGGHQNEDHLLENANNRNNAEADAEAAANISQQQLQQHEENEDSSGASSSSDAVIHIQPQAMQDIPQQPGLQNAMQNLQQQQPGLQNVGNGQPRIVSEVSSANTATNTSGSGSGGNSGSNSANSGSGSNQNSSGSGGENPGSSGNSGGSGVSGGEGKGSSDDVAKDDNSGGDANSNSNEMVVDATEATVPDPRKLPSAPEEQSQDDNASRDKKLISKKRKRMNMRREYEEQVQQELGSDSSQDEVVLRPGTPVTLDAVLSFTKNARVVVQATPPFLVVHANAAYSALTGIDSHFIIGKPIRTVLSVPESKERFVLTEINNADGSHSGQSSMTNSATINRQQQQATTLPNQQLQQLPEQQQADAVNNIRNHADAAAVGQARAQSNDIIEMNVERLVAASGFGYIHVMNVTAKPHIMLGRNVTVIREKGLAADQQMRRDGEQRSQGSSIPSQDGAFHAIACHMSVSPVVSSPSALDHPPPQVITDQEKSNRRRKHNYHHHHYRRHAKNNLVSHYVIQLEKVATVARAPKQSQGSISSTSKINSLDACKPPAAEEQETSRETAAEEPAAEEQDDATEASDQKEPVAAIG